MAASRWALAGSLTLALLLAGHDATAARRALVIGNDAYQHVPALRNARNDARSVATELEAAGFHVTRVLDGSRRAMNEAVDAFLRRIQRGDEVAFYFSGHGSQPPQTGPFLLPTDVEVSSERAIQRDGLSLEQLVDDLGQRARFSLVIVDACRDDPFRSSRAGRSMAPGSSLSRIEPPKGTLVIMAASKGQQALDRLSDNDPVANGVFTRELVKQMRLPGVSASEMLKRVRANVERAAQQINHAQRPALIDESSSEFYFHQARAGTTAPAAALAEPAPGPAAAMVSSYAPQREFDAWERASADTASLQAFVREHPKSRYLAHARLRLARLAGQPLPAMPDPLQGPADN